MTQIHFEDSPTYSAQEKAAILDDWIKLIQSGFRFEMLSDRLFRFILDTTGDLYHRYYDQDKLFFYQQQLGRTTAQLAAFIANFTTAPQGIEIHNPAWFDRFQDPDYGDLFEAMVETLDQSEETIFAVIEGFENDAYYSETELRYQSFLAAHPKADKEVQEENYEIIEGDVYDYFDHIGVEITDVLRRKLAEALRPKRVRRLSQPLLFAQQLKVRQVGPPRPNLPIHRLSLTTRANHQQIKRQTGQAPPARPNQAKKGAENDRSDQ